MTKRSITGPTRPLGSPRIDAAAILVSLDASRWGVFLGALLPLVGFVAGWYARGLFGVVWDQRGWAALLVLSIVGSVWIVSTGRDE